jgi:GWxTD domain-containing protein
MREACLIMVACIVFAVCFAEIVDAQLSDTYADWADGPAGLLLTKKERKEWAKITTDAEAEKFIDLFWARRNPDPSSSFNAFKAEFESRVRFADENFSYGEHRGSLSARGRVLILMGAPDRRQVRGIDGAPSVGAVSGATGAVENNTETWYYDPQNLPAGFKAKGAQLYFLFYEEKLDSNNFELDRTNRESFKAMSALSRAPEVYLLHPDLTEEPKPVSVPGAAPASAAHLAWLDSDEAPFDDSAIVISELGVADEVHRPLWIHLELPPEAPELDLIVGRVTGSDGQIVSTFELPTADPLPGQNGKFYHLTFPLQEGSYAIDIVGAAASEPQVRRELAAKISSIPTEGAWLSPVWLGTGVTPTPEARHGTAFTVGGWHLTPISRPELTRASEITYLGFVVRPALGTEGTVELLSQVDVKRNGVSIGRPLRLQLGVSRVIGDLYMYGNSVALTAIPEAGPYELVFQITEVNSNISVERSLRVEITE